MGVAVVQVRQVGVGVHELTVFVLMGVTPPVTVVMRVSVVSIVVSMLVVMGDAWVAVTVRVARIEGHRNAEAGERHSEQLDRGDRLAEHRPRDDRANEGRCREDDLSAGRAQVPGSLHPQGDRQAVSGGPDGEGRHDLSGRDGRYIAPQGQTQRQAEASSDESLGGNHVFGCEVIDPGRDAVVEPPAGARASDEQGAHAQLGAGLSYQQRPGHADQSGTGDDAPAEVLAEQGRGQGDGCEELEVQQNRRRRRLDAGKTSDEEHRSDRTASDDSDRHPAPVST
jgi:hypothetical protein